MALSHNVTISMRKDLKLVKRKIETNPTIGFQS